MALLDVVGAILALKVADRSLLRRITIELPGSPQALTKDRGGLHALSPRPKAMALSKAASTSACVDTSLKSAMPRYVPVPCRPAPSRNWRTAPLPDRPSSRAIAPSAHQQVAPGPDALVASPTLFRAKALWVQRSGSEISSRANTGSPNAS